MNEQAKGVSEKAMTALTIIVVEAIGLVQGINASPGGVGMDRVIRALDEIESRAKAVRKEIGQ